MREIVVLLHNIRSLHNVGSIFRTADGAGVKKIYLCGITPAPKDRFGKTPLPFKKVALGAEKTVGWDTSIRSPQAITKLIKKLKKEGFEILAVEQAKNSVAYNKPETRNYKQKKIALILGNEVGGIPPAILKKADKILEIPMRGAMVRQAHHPRRFGRGKESLNVSVAFGIAVYHFVLR